MNHVRTTRFATFRWCLLLLGVIWSGCSSPTFYPARYDGSTSSNSCKQTIKLYIDDVTATGAIDGGAILLQRPDGSLRRDGSKQWRDTPTELFRQAMESACLLDKWKTTITLVASPAQADLIITVHLRAFYVQVDDCEKPTGATAAAVVQFAPTEGSPSTESIANRGDDKSEGESKNLYSTTMGSALTKVVDGILVSACGKGSGISSTGVSPRVATIPAWDSLLQRDVGVVIALGSSNSGTISIRDRFGAPIVEWEIKQWKLDGAVATFDIAQPWSIAGATMEVLEEPSKKKRLLLRFTKIPGMKQLEIKEMTREIVAGELGKF